MSASHHIAIIEKGILFMEKIGFATLVAIGSLAVSFSVLASNGGQGEELSLSGVVDLHVHAGPDSRPRSVDDFQAAVQAL